MFGVYEPGTRTVYTNGIPSTAAGVGWLLDAILQLDRGLAEGSSLPDPGRTPSEPGLATVQDGKPSKPR
jgi:hypothetical protein